MAKRINGKEADPVSIRVMHIHNNLMEKLMEVLQANKEGDEGEYNKIAVVALINMGAVYAVDSGMSADTFMQIAQINYAGAYQAAPKWG